MIALTLPETCNVKANVSTSYIKTLPFLTNESIFISLKEQQVVSSTFQRNNCLKTASKVLSVSCCETFLWKWM